MENLVQISPILSPYLDDETSRLAPEKVQRYRKRLEKVLSPIEAWLMTIQSLLVWEKPYKSAILLGAVNVGFWIVSSRSNHILAVLSWGALFLYVVYMWKTTIWPKIRVPSTITDQEDWVPIDTGLVSVPEISQFLAESLVIIRLNMRALRNLRKRRPNAFVVLAALGCFALGMIGKMISGYVICYITIMTVLIWPCAVYHKIFQRVYMKLEPHYMTLQYKISAQIKSKFKRIKAVRPAAAQGDTAETDSDEDMVPSLDPELSAAIARTITDSEDESGGSPRAGTREPSTGYNSDIDNREAEDRFDEQSTVASFAPDVTQMPDFENICDESNTFMLETDFMPSMDDVDRSRMTPMAPSRIYDNDTASETESIPYDDELNAPSRPSNPHTQAFSVADPYSFSGKLMTAAATGLATTFVQGLQNTLSGAMSDAAADTDLRLDPRDRVADASQDEFQLDRMAGADLDDESDFEFVSKDDLDS